MKYRTTYTVPEESKNENGDYEIVMDGNKRQVKNRTFEFAVEAKNVADAIQVSKKRLEGTEGLQFSSVAHSNVNLP
jgi:hypothetical protein